MRAQTVLRIGLCLIALIAFAYLANQIGDWLTGKLKMEITDDNRGMIFGVTAVAIVLYILLIAIPFVPGVEIGLGLMMMFGTTMAIPVYVATVCGLCLGFAIGRVVPERVICNCFDFLGLTRISRMLKEMMQKPVAERMEMLTARAPKSIVPFLLRYRYVAIAAAFNIPGNSVIGGGGGLAFMSGASRLFAFPLYFIAVAIGVSPVPALVLAFGAGFLG